MRNNVWVLAVLLKLILLFWWGESSSFFFKFQFEIFDRKFCGWILFISRFTWTPLPVCVWQSGSNSEIGPYAFRTRVDTVFFHLLQENTSIFADSLMTLEDKINTLRELNNYFFTERRSFIEFCFEQTIYTGAENIISFRTREFILPASTVALYLRTRVSV